MSNPFDATASMLGYLFQCRLALADALRRLRYQGSFTVSLETLEDVVFETEGQPDADLVAIDDALIAFSSVDPRRAHVVELRLFGGLSIVETAETLGVSPETLMRD